MRLGLFSRKPAVAPEVSARLKRWVAALLSLGEADTIALAELACHDPGCPEWETVVTADCADGRRFVLRLPGPMAAVREADVQALAADLPR